MTQPADAQWPTIDPPATERPAKTPNIDRRTLTIALSVTGAAAIALIFAVVGFSGHHSSVTPPATSVGRDLPNAVTPPVESESTCAGSEARYYAAYNGYLGLNLLDPNDRLLVRGLADSMQRADYEGMVMKCAWEHSK